MEHHTHIYLVFFDQHPHLFEDEYFICIWSYFSETVLVFLNFLLNVSYVPRVQQCCVFIIIERGYISFLR